jgi:predicted O-methyltransferase YrrM
MSSFSLIGRIQKCAIRKVLTPWKIRALKSSTDPCLRKLGTALWSTLRRNLTTEEQRFTDRIERWRKSLIESKERVFVVDYGAGFPSEQRSEKQMNAGVTTLETVGEACIQYSKQALWTTLLFHLIRQFKPIAGVELGTCLGVSAAYQGAALELNGTGRIATLEGSAAFAKIAAEGIERLGLAHRVKVVEGKFKDTLEKVLNSLGTVDYAFIDGHHDEQATVSYFEQLLGYVGNTAVLVFDDIHNYAGMKCAWKRICANPMVDVVLDLFTIGICIVGAPMKTRRKLVIA